MNHKILATLGPVGYLTCPVSTGLRLVPLFPILDTMSPDERRQKIVELVIRPNKKDAAAAVEKLRSENSMPIINPSDFYVPEWGQSDYLSFWGDIIRKNVKKMWAMPGWEFSHGCNHEIRIAFEERIPLFDSRGNRITKLFAKKVFQNTMNIFPDDYIEEHPWINETAEYYRSI